jgi:hypothetical protein
MRLKLALLCVSLLPAAGVSSQVCDQRSSHAQYATGEVGWDPESCWECYQRESPVAAITLGTILGIPVGLSGILRRRYHNLDASRRLYSLQA